MTTVSGKVMKDPRLTNTMGPKAMPFDGMRAVCGGFRTLVAARAVGS